MILKALTPILRTNDLDATIGFYQSVIGFTLDEYNEDWGWCSVSKDEVVIMFATPDAHTPYSDPVFTGSFYLYTDQVDEAWETLQHKATVGYAIANFEHGMREFAILDNNGYMLQFGRPLKENETIDHTE